MGKLLLYTAAVKTGLQFVTSLTAAVYIMIQLHSRRESYYLLFQFLVPKSFRLHITQTLQFVLFVFGIAAFEDAWFEGTL